MRKIFLMAFTALFGLSAIFAAESYKESLSSSRLDLIADSAVEGEWDTKSGPAIPSPAIYQNPFMAPNNFSEVHGNAYQTDTYNIRGPGKSASKYTQDALLDSPTIGTSVLAFNNAG